MRKIREVLRLKYTNNLSNEQIGISCNISRECVRQYLQRAAKAGIPWPLPEEIDDAILEQKLFQYEYRIPHPPLPDWTIVHQEIKKKGVTLLLLWEEYIQNNPTGVKYSRFCWLYRNFKETLHPTMRLFHLAGEKLFVDFSGLTLAWIDKITGEVYKAEIFVAVLGASNYTYVEALESQSSACWIAAHVRLLDFIGGVPKIIVPDNLKAGISKPHYYDPEINIPYQEFANHYGTAIIPARVGMPRDKAKVEVGVQGIERRILAPLRDHRFFSIAEINQAITPLLNNYNKKPLQNLPGCRLSQFLEIDKPALAPLPKKRYEHAEWKKAKVHIDYHVAFEKHFYSVPHAYIKKVISLRITGTTVECYYQNQRIASHLRAFCHGHTTIKEHMPKAHQAYSEWTPSRLTQWASKIGPSTEKFIQAVIDSRTIPQQSYRACLGILRLGKSYGDDRLENAAKRALAIGTTRYQSIESILKQGLDRQPISADLQPLPQQTHANVRGANYYNN